MTPRQRLADAVRPFGPGGKLLPDHVGPLDALADALGMARDGALDAAAPPRVGLAPADFKAAADALGCKPAQVRAVWEVESGGGWFADVRADILALDGPGGFLDGPDLPKILFEAHKFHQFTGGRFDRSHPNLSSPTWNRALYVGGQGEYVRLYRAMQLDREAALKSASVGGAQIMGYNYRLAGFDTVEAFWQAMKESERAHLDAFATFIRSSGLAPALRAVTGSARDCVAFAKGYNGPGYAANGYQVKIAAAFAKWSDRP